MKVYILASLNLYGVFHLDDLTLVLKHYLKEVNTNLILETINELSNDINYDISFLNNILYSNYFDINLDNDLNEANLVLLESEGLNYYLPDKDIFLKYSNEFYIEESNSLIKLIKFINDNNIFKESYEGQIKKKLSLYYTKDGLNFDFNEYINFLEGIGFTFKNKELLNNFKYLLNYLKYDLRLFSNKANTINELIKDNKADDLVDLDLLELLLQKISHKKEVKLDSLINKYEHKYYIKLTKVDIYLITNYVNKNKKLNITYKKDLFIKDLIK